MTYSCFVLNLDVIFEISIFLFFPNLKAVQHLKYTLPFAFDAHSGNDIIHDVIIFSFIGKIYPNLSDTTEMRRCVLRHVIVKI